MPLGTLAFASGDKCIVKIGTIQIPSRDWTLAIKGMNHDVSNSRDGRKRIGGLEDADGDFKMPYDVGNDPTTTAAGGIKAAAILAGQFYLDATHFYGLSIIVDEIGPAVEFEGELMFPVKFSLESGFVTYPIYP